MDELLKLCDTVKELHKIWLTKGTKVAAKNLRAEILEMQKYCKPARAFVQEEQNNK